MARAEFGSLMTAMATPFQENGTLDDKGTAVLARHLEATGTDTIVVAGTTGESPTLEVGERMSLLHFTLNALEGDTQVVAGAGTYSTAESIRLAKTAEKQGAHGLLLVTPYYNKPSQEGLYRHFSAIAEAVEVPLILYNVPGRTVTNLQPQTVFRLVDRFPGHIVGIKEAVGLGSPEGRAQVRQLFNDRPDGFRIWSGNDEDTLAFVAMGGDGIVSVASHLVGAEIKSLMVLERDGRRTEAQAKYMKLLPLFRALFPPESPEASPAALKAALEIVGLPGGPLRLPLVDVPHDYKVILRGIINSYGLVPDESR